MSTNYLRGLETAALALLDKLRLPRMPLVVEFGSGLRLANWPTSITVGAKTYTGSKATENRHLLKVEGLGETLNFEVPSAVIEITSMNGWAQGTFFLDDFRGDTLTITQLYISGNSFLPTGWAATYTCDAELADADTVKIRLASNDAVNGTESPRRTSQGSGCQAELGVSDEEGGCPFRWVQGVHATALKTCSRTYYGANGCLAHFTPITDPVTGDLIRRVKPYNAFLGSVDHRLVKG